MTAGAQRPNGGVLAPASRVGPYEIVSPLGAGGMGEVYRATDTRLGRDVAIKVLPAEFASDPDRLRRFEQEARAVAALNHPSILAIHDIGSHEGAPYFVTELLEGETVRAALQRGAMKPRAAMELAAQIAQGLAAAHEKGIVHRDLKPGNVFITRDEHVKILDFGLAKAVSPTTREDRAKVTTLEEMTDAGKVMGTAAYMSPEQVRGVPVDQRSDIFSLGVVLYEMVTGRQAFGRESTTETMAAILKEDPPDPSSVSAVVPPALSRAIAHCLEKRPEERFQTARDLAFELKAIVADTTGGRTAPPRARARRVAALTATAATLLVLAAAGLWWVRRSNAPIRATNFQLISTFPGSHRWPTFSPDGSMIAFVSDADGSPQLWVKNLAGGDPIKITSGKLDPSHPSWSPFGDQIIFQGGEDLESQSIWSVPPLGGPPRRVLEGAFAPSFSADGRKIAFQRNIMGVFVCNSDGSAEQKIAGIPDDEVCAFDDGPVISPDGQLLAVYPALSGSGDLWVSPLHGGRGRRLTSDGTGGGHPVWTPDGKGIVFSSARTGSCNLWRVAAGGGKPEPLTSGVGDDDEPAISRDGRKLAYTNARNAYAVMALDVATGKSTQLLEQRTPVTFPSLSPSEEWLAFSSGGFGGGHVFLAAGDGAKLQQVPSGPGDSELLPLWSVDGRSLYYWREPGAAPPSLRKLAVGGGPSVEVMALTHGSYSPLSIAPDERRVAYGLSEVGKPPGTFVRDRVTGSVIRLALALENPRWSHDGSLLVGTVAGDERNRIFTCPPTGRPCTQVGTVKGVAPFWSQDDSRILFLWPGKSGSPFELRGVARDGSSEGRIGELPGVSLPSCFVLSVSGRGRVAWVQVRPGRREMWLADLKR